MNLLSVFPVFIGSALISGCGAPRSAPAKNQDEFAALFARNCAGCHGRDGRNGAAPSLNDAALQATMTGPALRQIVTNGLPGTLMPAFGQKAGGHLNDGEIQALVEGMKTKWGHAQAQFASPHQIAAEPEKGTSTQR
jgi:cytochrome c oxidase cbb3-type subunit 3/ubiquinol-cytochrome c reductase cytochrome c subunit